MNRNLKEAAFLVTIGIKPEIQLIDVPKFHGVLVEEGLAHINQKGNIAPYKEISYFVVERNTEKAVVTINTDGSRTRTPLWLYREDEKHDHNS